MGILSKIFNLNVKTIEESTVNNESTMNINIVDENSFEMIVDEVFTNIDCETVVVGKILKGTVKKGDTVKVGTITATVNELEIFRKQIGMSLNKIDRSQVSKGDLITK